MGANADHGPKGIEAALARPGSVNRPPNRTIAERSAGRRRSISFMRGCDPVPRDGVEEVNEATFEPASRSASLNQASGVPEKPWATAAGHADQTTSLICGINRQSANARPVISELQPAS